MTNCLVRHRRCGSFHFIAFSCIRRLPHLSTWATRNLFERSLKVIRARYRFFVIGYVPIPEIETLGSIQSDGELRCGPPAEGQFHDTVR